MNADQWIHRTAQSLFDDDDGRPDAIARNVLERLAQDSASEAADETYFIQCWLERVTNMPQRSAISIQPPGPGAQPIPLGGVNASLRGRWAGLTLASGVAALVALIVFADLDWTQPSPGSPAQPFVERPGLSPRVLRSADGDAAPGLVRELGVTLTPELRAAIMRHVASPDREAAERLFGAAGLPIPNPIPEISIRPSLVARLSMNPPTELRLRWNASGALEISEQPAP